MFVHFGNEIALQLIFDEGEATDKGVDLFKQAIGRSEHSKALERFCKELFQGISSCNAEPAASTDDRRERSYQLFYERRIGCLKELWNDFYGILQLPQPDPLWTQIVNRLNGYILEHSRSKDRF